MRGGGGRKWHHAALVFTWVFFIFFQEIFTRTKYSVLASISSDQCWPHSGGPHSLPVQRISVRISPCLHWGHHVRTLPVERYPLCHPPKSEAHLPLLRASVLCLPFNELLFRQVISQIAIFFVEQFFNCKSCQAWADRCNRLRHFSRAVYIRGRNFECYCKTFSLQAGANTRVLGAKFLGSVQRARSRWLEARLEICRPDICCCFNFDWWTRTRKWTCTLAKRSTSGNLSI